MSARRWLARPASMRYDGCISPWNRQPVLRVLRVDRETRLAKEDNP
jgi:hypothetical protein